MGVPAPIQSAILAFVFIAFGLCCLTFLMKVVGMVSKETAGIAYVQFIIGSVCMFVMWLCTWMHQWHPLIYPTYEGEE
ncbi:unnamed protein product [Heterosigma akashiwo]